MAQMMWIQRTIKRTVDSLMENSRSFFRYTRRSIVPRHQLIEVLQEFLPAELGTAEGLRLIGAEARLLHAKASTAAGRSEDKGHHARQIVGGIFVRMVPGVGQRLVRLDGENLAVQYATPVAAKIEMMADGRFEVVLHQPLLDQMRLGQRAPEFFRRKRKFPLDHDGANLVSVLVH